VSAHCFAPPDATAPRCLANDAVMCTTASTPHTCADATHTTYCQNWVQQTEVCTLLGNTSLCDAASGTCLFPPPCNPAWPFVETCAGPDNKWTKGVCANGYASLAPCSGCAPASGTGVTCGGDGG
jgi:hypothetical protein